MDNCNANFNIVEILSENRSTKIGGKEELGSNNDSEDDKSVEKSDNKSMKDGQSLDYEVEDEDIRVTESCEQDNTNETIVKDVDLSPVQVNKIRRGTNKQKEGKGDKEFATPVKLSSNRIASKKLQQ
ncbi:hypothetical protein HAX54_050828 [Datura stramonium]|uniref:Uncharacterized protein n=1 Tax=Datura stramonium TaxID=4076 RepID=A0ABS8SYK0_DATST|nr:hypothetical protein [Datura stramonium]